jgi:tellurite resistance protein TerC
MTDLAWVQVVPVAGVAVVVAAEVVASRRAGAEMLTVRSAVRWAAAYVTLAVLFGLGTGIAHGWTVAGQFYAGYLTEYSLSLDNLFIFYVIMTRLAVRPDRQHRVLMAGIGVALVLRSVLIVAGTAAVTRWDWLFYPLGGLLVWTAAGLLSGKDGPEGQQQHTRLLSWLRPREAPDGAATMLLLAVAIGVADLLFAFDSIPAVFGITTSAVLIVACNVFALMGLRQLYVLLTRMLDRMVYLNQGLAVICSFIGVKLFLRALHGSGVRWAPDIAALPSVLVVATVLAATITAGLLASRPGLAGALAPPLTIGQHVQLNRRFAVLDIDCDGTWQRQDYEQQAQRVCDAFGHTADSPARLRVAAAQRGLFSALLVHMDSNGDQQITLSEFASSIGRAIADQPGFDAAISAAAFSLLQAADMDGNGVLDTEEYARLTAAYGASTQQASQAFRALDLDHNGVIDLAELTQAIRQFFTSPDPRTPGNLAFGHL